MLMLALVALQVVSVNAIAIYAANCHKLEFEKASSSQIVYVYVNDICY
jgi:hypothetical protein